MRMHQVVTSIVTLALSASIAFAGGGTAFTYQGRLLDAGELANGLFDFEFSLWDAANGGNPIGVAQVLNNTPVTDGLFTVQIDFGDDAFNGQARWLEIVVDGTILSPRQPLTPAPIALTLPGLWIQQNGTSPNLIGGLSGNNVTAGVFGATISGGGTSVLTNRVTDNFGTIGGGANNQAGDNAGTTLDRRFATVGGGVFNAASGIHATVGGGSGNTASGGRATVGGGETNTASGPWATVGGGVDNTASGLESTVGGGFNNTASGFMTTVGGGVLNAASGLRATVGGGSTNFANGDWATVGGGYSNQATASYATIAGGGRSIPGDPLTGNRVTDDYGTIGGGGNNQAGDNAGTPNDAPYATVGGGIGNTASDRFATVGGGENNSAGDRGTVGGGHNNDASGLESTVGGGFLNVASGLRATVGGGSFNTASQLGATVPGGVSCTASGVYSFAAGRRAFAGHGTFSWADSIDQDFLPVGSNTFNVRASGGTNIYSNPNLTAGVRLFSGASSWSAVSDRSLKANFTPVDGRDILERLASIPIETWNLKSQDPSIRHIGPMAQDFDAAFGVGEDNKYISTVDADGVALAAIQGLYQLVQEKDEEITDLKVRLAALEAMVERLVLDRNRGAP